MERIRDERRCLAHSGMYFPAHSGPCDGQMITLPAFFMWHPSGDLNAYVCAHHAKMFWAAHTRGYLWNRLYDAQRGNGGTN